MEFQIDIRTIFIGLGFVLSTVSLWLSISAKIEAREAKLIELLHQKRMLLTTLFAEVQKVVRGLKDVDFENEDLSRSYKQLSDFRVRLIDALNEESEMSANPEKLNKELIYNQMSDFNLMFSIHKSDLRDLEKYLDKNT